MSNIRWEDMVFMNRNQSYGAYLLRKAYPDRVNISFAFAMMVIGLILFSPNIKAMFINEEAFVPEAKKVEKVIEMQVVPPIEMPTIPPPRVDVPPPAERFAPRVTDQEVDTVIPENDDFKPADLSTDTGEGVTFVEGPAAVELPTVTTPQPEPIYVWVEVAPEFPGGIKEMIKFIGKNIKYPAIDRRMGTEGTVFVSFVVDTDGTITDVKTDKGISGGCDEEAMRVIAKMPKWKPGRQGGKAVKVRFVLPIKFSLGGA